MTQSRHSHIWRPPSIEIAVRVGVAGGVEPDEGHALAEVRAGEQAVDEFFVGVGALSATKASTSSAEGGRPVRSSERRRMSVRRSASGDVLQFLGIEAREDEVVDFVARPGSCRTLPGTAAFTGGMNDQCLA